MLKRFVLIAVLAGAGGALTVAPSAASQAPLVHCGRPGNGKGPSNDRSLPIGPITARGMSCSAARRSIRHGSIIFHGNCFGGPGGSPCKSTFATRGFRCTAVPLGVVHCTARDRRFNFDWSE